LARGYGVMFSPDENSLALVRPNEGVSACAVSISRVMRRLAGPIGCAADMRDLAFSQDEQWIAGVSLDGLFVWNANLNRIVTRKPVSGAFAVLSRPKGSELLVGSESGIMRQPWSVVTNAVGKDELCL